VLQTEYGRWKCWGGVDGCGLVGGKPDAPQGPILICEGEAPNFGVSHSLVLLWQRERERERGGRGGGGPGGRGGVSLLTDMPDTQEKLTEIYDVQIYGGKQKGNRGDRKTGKEKVSDT